MQLKDIMTRDVKSVMPDMTLSDVAKWMASSDIGCMPVVRDGRLIGIITDRDIVVRALAKDKNPGSTPVEETMTANPHCLKADDRILNAAELMERHKIRRIPVVDSEGQLVGILTLDDLAEHAHELVEQHEPLRRL